MADGVVDPSKPDGTLTFGQIWSDIKSNFAQIVIHIGCMTAHGLDSVLARIGGVESEIAGARGSRTGLSQRLSMALNDDGTLKATVTTTNLSEWVDPQMQPGRVDAFTFTVTGNHADIFSPLRKVQLSDGTTVAVSMIAGSVYNGSTATTVTLYDPAVMVNPTSVKYGFVTPGASGSLDPRVVIPANNNPTIGGF